MASVLNEAYFTDEAAAFKALEAIVWPNGPTCPHCGGTDRINRLEGVKDKKGRVRLGLLKCYDCRGQFTVRKGTIFESSHLKLHQWFQAAYLMCASKKGVSSNQLHRTLGCTLKTAWFVSHRLREAMREGHFPIMGGEGKTVEIDETYVGGKERNKHSNKRIKDANGGIGKEAVFSLVERGGAVRSHHVTTVSRSTLGPILQAQLHVATDVMSDGGGARVGELFASHQSVNHGIGEYVRGDVHTNTIEGFFSILKRGITGTYHHVSPKHLKRYLAEFDFRYNNRVALGVDDSARTETVLRGIVGKRLTYRDSSVPAAGE
jgi:transposase-like protein